MSPPDCWTGVLVCTLNPDYTDTNMLKGDGFPQKLNQYDLGGLKDPAWVAEQGVRAVVRGKAVHVPGFLTWFSLVFLPRFLPRSAMRAIAYRQLKAKHG